MRNPILLGRLLQVSHVQDEEGLLPPVQDQIQRGGEAVGAYSKVIVLSSLIRLMIVLWLFTRSLSGTKWQNCGRSSKSVCFRDIETKNSVVSLLDHTACSSIRLLTLSGGSLRGGDPRPRGERGRLGGRRRRPRPGPRHSPRLPGVPLEVNCTQYDAQRMSYRGNHLFLQLPNITKCKSWRYGNHQLLTSLIFHTKCRHVGMMEEIHCANHSMENFIPLQKGNMCKFPFKTRKELQSKDVKFAYWSTYPTWP